MKTTRINLIKWRSEDADIIDIDWPKVQKTLGVDQVKWLLDQPKTDCELVIDKNDSDFSLIAEFYNQQSLRQYYLMWAK